MTVNVLKQLIHFRCHSGDSDTGDDLNEKMFYFGIRKK